MKITNHTQKEISDNNAKIDNGDYSRLLTIFRPRLLKSGRYFLTMNPGNTVWYDENDNPFTATNIEEGDLMTPDGKNPGFFFDLTPGVIEVETEQTGNLFSEMYSWIGDN